MGKSKWPIAMAQVFDPDSKCGGCRGKQRVSRDALL